MQMYYYVKTWEQNKKVVRWKNSVVVSKSSRKYKTVGSLVYKKVISGIPFWIYEYYKTQM